MGCDGCRWDQPNEAGDWTCLDCGAPSTTPQPGTSNTTPTAAPGRTCHTWVRRTTRLQTDFEVSMPRSVERCPGSVAVIGASEQVTDPPDYEPTDYSELPTFDPHPAGGASLGGHLLHRLLPGIPNTGPKRSVRWCGGAPPKPPQWKCDAQDPRAYSKFAKLFGRFSSPIT